MFTPIGKLDFFLEIGNSQIGLSQDFFTKVCHLRQTKGRQVKPLIYLHQYKSFVTYLKVLQRVFRWGCNEIERFSRDTRSGYKTRKLGVCA